MNRTVKEDRQMRKKRYQDLNKKKNIVYDSDSDQQMKGLRKQASSKPKRDGIINLIRQYTKLKGKLNTFIQCVINEQDRSCGICSREDFLDGRFIFGCKHNICNQCFRYWSQVKRQCPVCNRRVQEIISILNESFRQKELKDLQIVPNCEECKQNINYNSMYFCDSCNNRSIHVYCPPYANRPQDRWFCKQCRQQGYEHSDESFYQNSQSEGQQNHYEQISSVSNEWQHQNDWSYEYYSQYEIEGYDQQYYNLNPTIKKEDKRTPKRDWRKK